MCWIKYFYCCLHASLLLIHLQSSIAADCDGWTFLCEETEIFVDESAARKPIRMPLDSSTCQKNGAAAKCESTLATKKGQKILVKTGLLFEVGPSVLPCDSTRHVKFSSKGSTLLKSNKKCGNIASGVLLFESVSDRLTMTYTSSSEEDGAVITAEVFGCSQEGFVASNPDTLLQLTNPDFRPSDSQYEGLLMCRDGYLMPGNVSRATTYCRSSAGVSKTWKWDIPSEEHSCNRVTCSQIMPPTDGQYELSNGLYHQSLATFTCGEGYVLRGGTSQTCIVESGVGGYWEGTTPTCEIIDCDTPLMIENSTYTLPSITTYQSMFEYSCNEGLHPPTAYATCMSNGSWSYALCQAITCTSPPKLSDWTKITSDTEPWLLGATVSYSCAHSNAIASIECERSGNSIFGSWSSLPDCMKKLPLVPLALTSTTTERITRGPKATKQDKPNKNIIIVGGVIAGVVFAIIVIVLACIFIRKSKANNRKASQNNNNDVELKKPLNSSEKANCNGTKAKPGLVIEKETTANEHEPAAVVKHFRNRGNDRVKNGMNGNAGSHKSSQASSVSLLGTSDLFDSVLHGNGTAFDRKSGSYGRKSLVSADRRSNGISDRRSAASSDGSSATSSDQKTIASVDRKSNESCDKKSGSSDSSSRKLRPEYNGEINGDLNESQIDGIMSPNKHSTPKCRSSDFM